MDQLERFAAADLDAFEALFRQHQGEVCSWIARIVRNASAAEDLTIETFWRIYQHRARFDTSRPFGPWARRIATRLAVDYLRSAEFTHAGAKDVPVPPAGDPLLQRELQIQIRGAFLALPAKLRAAATLALIEERPYSEIAEALDISLSAVKMRVARAVRILRKKLARMGLQI